MKKIALLLSVFMILTSTIGWAVEESFMNFIEDETVEVLVQFNETVIVEVVSPNYSRRFKKTKATFLEDQHNKLINIKKDIPNIHIKKQFVTAINGAVVEINKKYIPELESRPEVLKVIPLIEYRRPEIEAVEVNMNELANQVYENEFDGLTGAGVVVSIIDSGIDYYHKDMRIDEGTVSKWSKSNIDTFIIDNDLNGKYYTEKVPYGYNFADNNTNVIDVDDDGSYLGFTEENPPNVDDRDTEDNKCVAVDASMHGMHVAGIVGANDDESDSQPGINGVAPNVQLFAMKVFSNDQSISGTNESTIIEAIEESITLGVDVINISIGSPAGNVDSDNALQIAVNNAVANGTIVCISAGNSAYFGKDHSSGKNPYARNPDFGTLGTPGISIDSLQVASIKPDTTINHYSLTVTDTPPEEPLETFIEESIVKTPVSEEEEEGIDESTIEVPSDILFEEPEPIDEDPIEEEPSAQEPPEEQPVEGDPIEDVPQEQPHNIKPLMEEALLKANFSETAEAAIVTLDGYSSDDWTAFNGTYTLVFEDAGLLPGAGIEEIAVVERGSATIHALVTDASNKGFIGVIIFNQANGMDLPYEFGNYAIPVMYITLENYHQMNLDNQPLTLNLSLISQFDDPTSGDISYFSSWGTTPSMDFKPNIAAIGSSVYSTANEISDNTDPFSGYDQDYKYMYMSGTSMASPQVAGGSALLIEKYNRENITASKTDWVENYICNYSTPIEASNTTTSDVKYVSPRGQGSGAMNMKNSANADVYVTGPDGNPFFNFGSWQQPYSFNFDLEFINEGTSDITYDVSFEVSVPRVDLIDGAYETTFTPENVAHTKSHSSISVPMGSSNNLITMSLSDYDVFDPFVSGTFVEGYLILDDQSGNAPSIYIPFISFYGHWDEVPSIDAIRGEADSFYETSGIIRNTDSGFVYSSIPNGAFSPNNDDYNDTVYMAFSVMRNMLSLEIDIVDEHFDPTIHLQMIDGQLIDTSVIEHIDSEGEITKQYYYNLPSPKTYFFESIHGWDGNDYPDGEYYYRFTTPKHTNPSELTYDYIRFNIDTTAPVVITENYYPATRQLIVSSNDISGIESYVLQDESGTILDTDNTGNSTGLLNVPDTYSESTIYVVATDQNKIESEPQMVVLQATSPEMVVSHDLNIPMNGTTIDYTVFGFLMNDPSLIINEVPITLLEENNYHYYQYSQSSLSEQYYTFDIVMEDDDDSDPLTDSVVYEESIFAIIDWTNPEITGLSFNNYLLEDSSYLTTTNTLIISGSISDNLPIMAVEVNGEVQVSFNETAVLGESSYGTYSEDFTFQYTLSDDDDSITVSAVDEALNRTDYTYDIERPATVTRVELNYASSVTVDVDDTVSISLDAYYSDGTKIDVSFGDVQWTYNSSNFIVSNGNIRGVSESSSTLTASYGGKSDSITVHVEEESITPPPSGGGSSGGSSGGGSSSGGSTIPEPEDLEATLIEDDVVPLGYHNYKGTYIDGYPDKTFRPNDPLKRSEVSKLFFISLQLENDLPLMSFSDVSGHWALDYIYALNRAKLIDGYPDKTFRPERYIKRSEYAKMLAQAMIVLYPDYAGSQMHYTDIKDHWAKDYIEKLYSFGVYSDSTATEFRPEDYVTRAEAVVMMNKMLLRSPINTRNTSFIDVPSAFWAHGHIEAACQGNEELTAK